MRRRSGFIKFFVCTYSNLSFACNRLYNTYSINVEEKVIYRLYIFGHIKCSPLEKTISSADINVGVIYENVIF